MFCLINQIPHPQSILFMAVVFVFHRQQICAVYFTTSLYTINHEPLEIRMKTRVLWATVYLIYKTDFFKFKFC